MYPEYSLHYQSFPAHRWLRHVLARVPQNKFFLSMDSLRFSFHMVCSWSEAQFMGMYIFKLTLVIVVICADLCLFFIPFSWSNTEVKRTWSKWSCHGIRATHFSKEIVLELCLFFIPFSSLNIEVKRSRSKWSDGAMLNGLKCYVWQNTYWKVCCLCFVHNLLDLCFVLLSSINSWKRETI